jgi:hypothetical protein
VSFIVWSVAAVAAAVLIAADVLRDRARQQRETREWSEIVQALEEEQSW